MNNPPAGVLYYACTNVQNNLLYFGGNCNPGDCYHNNLYSLNTLTLNWSEIISAPLDNVPMRKHGCGMISFNVNGEDNLFLSGGKGLTPVTQQTHSQYVPSPSNPHLSYTNEIHCMNLTSSPGITCIHDIIYYIIMISCIFFRSMDSTCHKRYSSTTLCRVHS